MNFLLRRSNSDSGSFNGDRSDSVDLLSYDLYAEYGGTVILTNVAVYDTTHNLEGEGSSYILVIKL
jgi:hypothetical protein